MSNNDTQADDSYEEIDDDGKVSHNKKKHSNGDLAVQNIMRTESGRDFIYGQLVSCGVYESTFDMNTIQSSYNAGLRDAGLRLEREVKEAAPEYYLKMIKENM